MYRPKPIKYIPMPVPATPFLICDRCGEDCSNDMGSMVRYEEIDKGDYIERRDVENICGVCHKRANDQEKQRKLIAQDLLQYGVAYELHGKRIDPKSLVIHKRTS